jgi:hypothetical protein
MAALGEEASILGIAPENKRSVKKESAKQIRKLKNEGAGNQAVKT